MLLAPQLVSAKAAGENSSAVTLKPILLTWNIPGDSRSHTHTEGYQRSSIDPPVFHSLIPGPLGTSGVRGRSMVLQLS